MKIVLFGAGNVATYLGRTLAAQNFNIQQVYNRTPSKGQALANSISAKYCNNIEDIDPNADLYLIAVSDNHIQEIVSHLNSQIKGIVVHTSGATPLSVLERFKKTGVLYPVQSIHKEVSFDTLSVPFAIEGNTIESQKQLLNFASKLTQNTFICDSSQRLAIHVAAVFVNNFSNTLYTIAADILANNKLNFDVLQPLLMKTAENARGINQSSIQTGPAIRNDIKTIDKHLDFLRDTRDLAEIYQIMTNYIIKSKQKGNSN